MPATIECPACQSSAAIPEDFLGRKVKCRMCQEVFVAPKPPRGADIVEDEPRSEKRPVDDDVDGVTDQVRPAKAKNVPAAPVKVGALVYVLMAFVGFGLFGGGSVLTYFAVISESKPTMQGDGTIPPPPSGLGGNKGMGKGGGGVPAPPPPPPSKPPM